MNIKLVCKFLFVCFVFSLPLQVLSESDENSPSDESKESSSSDEGEELSSFEQFLQGTFTSQLSLPPEPPLPPTTPEQRKKFPLPRNRNELPKPIQQYIQEIEDLCKIDSLEEQVPKVKKTLDGLEEAIDFYLYHYNHKQVNVSHLGKIHIDLFEGTIPIEWRYLNTNFRRNVSEHFLIHRSFMTRLEDAGPKTFKWSWEHKIYRGLYCLSYGRPPTLP